MSNSSHSAEHPVICWFRQDLRVSDNPALLAAVKSGRPVICLYILDDHAAGKWARGGASRWWLHHSLASLEAALKAFGSKLILRRGDANEIITGLADQMGAKAVFWNRCYEPFARDRDARIKARLKEQDREVETFNGSLLVEPWHLKTKDGGPFRVYSPYFRALAPHCDDIAPLPAPTVSAISSALESSLLM